MSYMIVRFYQNGGSLSPFPRRRVIARGLSLEQAQEWCKDPETSSTTCKKPHNRARTRRMGPWFDGYEQE